MNGSFEPWKSPTITQVLSRALEVKVSDDSCITEELESEIRPLVPSEVHSHENAIGPANIEDMDASSMRWICLYAFCFAF